MATHNSRRNILDRWQYGRLTGSERRMIRREEAEKEAARLSCLRRIKAEREAKYREEQQVLTLEVAEHYSRFGLPDCSDPGGGGIRGKVREFTRAARRRMILDFGKLKKYPGAWITPTFADDVMEGKSISERAALSSSIRKRFSEWLTYHYPECWGLWRREWEVRKSGKLKGELVPHFHIMIELGIEDAEKLDTELVKILMKWVEMTGTNHPEAEGRARAQESRAILHDKAMAQRYVAKYMSKSTQAALEGIEESETMGRHWGRIAEPPYGRVFRYVLDRYESVWLRRLLSKMCRGTSKGARSMKKKLREGVGWVFVAKATVCELLAWIGAIRTWKMTENCCTGVG